MTKISHVDALAAIETLRQYLAQGRFAPDKHTDQSLTRLAREVQDWEQDVYAQQTAGSGRWS